MEYYTCDKCNGIGKIKNPDLENRNSFFHPSTYVKCPKCLGSKKLNWLENIFGKETKKMVFHVPHRNLSLEEIEKIRKSLEESMGLHRRYLCGNFEQK